MEMTLVDFNEKIGFAKMSGKSYVGGKVRAVLPISNSLELL
jgi:hypothetical protein